MAGEEPLMGVSWSGIRVVACSGTVLGDCDQIMSCGSCEGHYREFLIRVPGMASMGAALSGTSWSGATAGPSVGDINWSSPPKSRLWWVFVTLGDFWSSLEA